VDDPVDYDEWQYEEYDEFSEASDRGMCDFKANGESDGAQV
jgi:hypothetical protein